MTTVNNRIVAQNLSIDFPIYDPRSRSLRHRLVVTPLSNVMGGAKYVGGTITTTQGGVVIVRAINNISFDIKSGERIGVIGHNGAGKTTLLRTLAGIYEPTEGTLEATGRIMPLFNLMEGLMPEATGREFVRIRGMLLGFDAYEMNHLIEDVLEFCELGGYIDMPVRTYSTGMLVRLAFAIATNVTSDILLFDELIGAGDARFHQKAQMRLESLIYRSSIVVVATHATESLLKWCSRALLMEHGKLIHFGDVQETLDIYEERRAAGGS